ncbi:MAG TPA: PLDc N-terminal domain-containing protein [Streptosporangiaceae bacterium]
MNYPLLDAFLTMMWFSVWVLWLFLVVWTILNIFRRQDLHGWGKAAWTALVILVPLIGVFAYLIVHGGHLAERQVEQANAPQDEAASAYERWESHGRRGR